LNNQYCTSLPRDLAARLDAMASAEGWSWQNAYKLALWLGFVAAEEKGALRKVETALGGELTKSVVGWRARPIHIPRETRDLVGMAARENMPWRRAHRVALEAGIDTIKARGGLIETKRQVEALRRLVRTQAFGLRAPHSPSKDGRSPERPMACRETRVLPNAPSPVSWRPSPA
jgi:hypothetical protein